MSGVLERMIARIHAPLSEITPLASRVGAFKTISPAIPAPDLSNDYSRASHPVQSPVSPDFERSDESIAAALRPLRHHALVRSIRSGRDAAGDPVASELDVAADPVAPALDVAAELVALELAVEAEPGVGQPTILRRATPQLVQSEKNETPAGTSAAKLSDVAEFVAQQPIATRRPTSRIVDGEEASPPLRNEEPAIKSVGESRAELRDASRRRNDLPHASEAPAPAEVVIAIDRIEVNAAPSPASLPRARKFRPRVTLGEFLARDGFAKR